MMHLGHDLMERETDLILFYAGKNLDTISFLNYPLDRGSSVLRKK
jgi:hypothetical protein